MLSTNIIRYGQDKPQPPQQTLCAGPLSLIYENGDLRYVHLGDKEVLRRVYVAVRDRNWGTVPIQISNETVEDNGDCFQISYMATHQQNEIGFVWRAQIRGEKNGTISFSMEGEAQTTFLRNRIGFCVLHPASSAGAKCRVIHDDNSIEEKPLPRFIDPAAPFLNIRSIAHEVKTGVWARLDFTGDVFEMEDQRNWIDASFKTFCTPLGLPFPVEIKAGTKIVQSVNMTLEGEAKTDASTHNNENVRIVIENEILGCLPQIGLGVASHGEKLSEREAELLRALNLLHLRVDLKLWQSEYPKELQPAMEQAQQLNTRLEIALWLSDAAEVELDAFIAQLYKLQPPIARFVVFHQNENTTGEKWIGIAREKLKNYDAKIPLGGGTDAFFTQLNRERPENQNLDFVNFSANPQVHAFDNLSIAETTEVAGATVESAREFCPNKPISVSPITLKIRWNPAATGPERKLTPGEWPPQVDARQMSLFGAAWTLGALAGFVFADAQYLTFYETTGWLGVMETDNGSPNSFPSLPRSVFPMYHVFADVGEFRGAEIVSSTHHAPLRIAGLVLRKEDKTRILLANLTNEEQQVEIHNLSPIVARRVLDESCAKVAMLEPRTFRAQRQKSDTQNGKMSLTLRPYAYVCIDNVE